jgi:hypothetical protein
MARAIGAPPGCCNCGCCQQGQVTRFVARGLSPIKAGSESWRLGLESRFETVKWCFERMLLARQHQSAGTVKNEDGISQFNVFELTFAEW